MKEPEYHLDECERVIRPVKDHSYFEIMWRCAPGCPLDLRKEDK